MNRAVQFELMWITERWFRGVFRSDLSISYANIIASLEAFHLGRAD